MARKNKRSQLRKPQRGGASQRAARPTGVGPIAPTSAAPDVPTAPSPAAPPAPAAASSRLVQRPLPRGRGRQQLGPLPAEDAAIPLDRVPYFRADVIRIALTAAVMLVLLIVGSFVLRGMLQA